MASADQISCRNLGRQSWSSAPTERRASHINHPSQRRTAERLRRGWEEWAGIAAEIIPEGVSNAGQSLSHGLRPCQLPLHKGAFGDGGYGLPRRFAPRNDSPDPLSFRGGPTGRRGNPSFLRWTWVRAAESSAPTGGCREPPQPPGQRSERGKRSWSNSGFARRLSCAARGTGFGGLIGTPPVLT